MTFTQGLLSLVELPFSTDYYSLLGVNDTLVQPPLPAGHDKYGILAGTDGWAACVPGQYTDKTSVGIIDLDQSGGDGEGNANGTNAVGDEFFQNFWPGLPRINVGLKLEDATITFSDAETWQ
jgi:hypothetical protein